MGQTNLVTLCHANLRFINFLSHDEVIPSIILKQWGGGGNLTNWIPHRQLHRHRHKARSRRRWTLSQDGGKELLSPRIPQQHERLSIHHPCELWDTWRVSRHTVSKTTWPMKKTRLIPYKKHRVLPTNMHPRRNAFSYQRSCLLLNPSGDQCSHTTFTGLLMNWVTLRMSFCFAQQHHHLP